MHDLFFWATLSGHSELAYMLWKLTDHPLHTALLGAHICRLVSSRSWMATPGGRERTA